jgi:tRNA (cytosine38-C5)-methyltransferase
MLGDSSVRPKVRALEFFSGIGGLHYGLCEALGDNSEAEVVAAFDINQNANVWYVCLVRQQAIQDLIKTSK